MSSALYLVVILTFTFTSLPKLVYTYNNDIGACGISKSIVHSLDIDTNLINHGWKNCYSVPYSTATTIETLTSMCPTGDSLYLFVGAKQTSSSSSIYIGAYGPSQVLTDFTSSSFIAYKPHIFTNDPTYNVYWYNFADKSFGFTSDRTISLFTADTYNATDNNRLSWETHHDHGGYRAGNIINLNPNGIWQKVVYYKHCTDIGYANVVTSSPTAPKTPNPTNITPQLTNKPTSTPTMNPTQNPTASDWTSTKTLDPTLSQTMHPTLSLTMHPAPSPTMHPTQPLTMHPTSPPLMHATPSPINPTSSPTMHPTPFPTTNPTLLPTMNATTASAPTPTDTPTIPPLEADHTHSPSDNRTIEPPADEAVNDIDVFEESTIESKKDIDEMAIGIIVGASFVALIIVVSIVYIRERLKRKDYERAPTHDI